MTSDPRDRNGDGRVDLSEKLYAFTPSPCKRGRFDARSKADRAVDNFVAMFGSLRFIAWMTVFIAVWIVLNSLVWALKWDPYPWILLILIFPRRRRTPPR